METWWKGGLPENFDLNSKKKAFVFVNEQF